MTSSAPQPWQDTATTRTSSTIHRLCPAWDSAAKATLTTPAGLGPTSTPVRRDTWQPPVAGQFAEAFAPHSSHGPTTPLVDTAAS